MTSPLRSSASTPHSSAPCSLRLMAITRSENGSCWTSVPATSTHRAARTRGSLRRSDIAISPPSFLRQVGEASLGGAGEPLLRPLSFVWHLRFVLPCPNRYDSWRIPIPHAPCRKSRAHYRRHLGYRRGHRPVVCPRGSACCNHRTQRSARPRGHGQGP